MNKKRIIWALMVLLVIGLLSVLVFARPPYEICCASSSHCVLGDICVGSGNTMYDVDQDGDNDICLDTEWWDCNADSQCPANQWCDTGAKDCEDDLGLCDPCSRTAQCASGNFCLSGKCRVAYSESGLCYNGIDDDCDGDIDFADSDCCSVEGASCSSDSQCCGAMPCDGVGSTCGCPTGFYWDEFSEDCLLSGVECAPPSNCDTYPYQTACIRYSFPDPFAPTEGCCYFDTYEGTTYYDWHVDHITTY